jgi:predicted small metal-binding protein
VTLKFSCADVGVVCKDSVTAEDEDELVAKIAEHAAQVHDVPKLTQTLVNYAKSVVKVVDSDS